MHPALPLLLSCSLVAADPPPALDEAFFNRERIQILKSLADRLGSLKPDDPRYMADCARAHLAALDLAKARELFKAAEARDPKDGMLLRQIGLAWLKHGHRDEAFGTYRLILQRDPKNKEALLSSAVDLAELGQTAEAEKFSAAYLALEKDDWRAFVAFGRAYLVSGQRQKAAQWFARGVASKPKEEKVYQDILRAFTETQSVF
ncbi:MAG: hypothetical protein HY823_08245 [Acidobacteria bacterium]|nr:hypothetical protein [Acidobacteriota bacterium]